MEAFKLPIIGTLFCYAKNGIKFFETPVDQLFILDPLKASPIKFLKLQLISYLFNLALF